MHVVYYTQPDLDVVAGSSASHAAPTVSVARCSSRLASKSYHSVVELLDSSDDLDSDQDFEYDEDADSSGVPSGIYILFCFCNPYPH